MRITGNMITQSQIAGLAANIAALDRAQVQVTTGHKLQQASDDPTAATQIMASGTSLRALDQYRTNVTRASSRVDLEDSVLQQIGDLVTRAKELGIQQGGDTATPQTRKIAGAEVDQLMKEIVSLGNTKFGGEYLFGGEQATTPPFSATGSGATLDYTSTAPSGTRTIQIGDGQSMQVTHDGSQLLIGTGVLDAVRQLGRALDPTSTTYGTAGVAGALTSIDNAFDSLQTVVGDVGARSKQLDTAKQNLDAYKTNLTTFKSNLEDVDVETAVTELTNRQMAYQAAMLSTTKVMGLTLTDYLK